MGFETSERRPLSAMHDFTRTWGALLAEGLVSGLGWVVVGRNLATADPSTIPTWQMLRSMPHGHSDILRKSVSWGALRRAPTIRFTLDTRACSIRCEQRT